MLNKSKGNMYPFVTHTWNTIKGKCPHDCAYCYMKKWRTQPELHFDEKELKTDLGKGNFIFVGSSCDMWAWTIPKEWIEKTLGHCREYPNIYLFQSKEPGRFQIFYGQFSGSRVFGTTIETNRQEYIDEFCKDAPTIMQREFDIYNISKEDGEQTMVTIEPIMDFDLKPMVEMITDIEPEWVNIGANTNHKVKLPEPPPEKIRELIEALKTITNVKIKRNLSRLMPILDGHKWEEVPG